MSFHDRSCLAVSATEEWNGPTFGQNSVLALDSPRATAAEKVPTWLFVSGDERVRSSKPVEVIIRHEDSAYLVECERLNIFASGESRNDAIDSLHRQVVYFFKRYTKLSANEVIGQAAELRGLYTGYFAISN